MIKRESIPDIFKSIESSYSNVLYLTDAVVYTFYKDYFPIEKTIIIPAGEQFKDLDVINIILKEMIKKNASRKTFLVGVGGGVVTDMTGLVASLYMRGIKFGFVSTTLLGMVDASIGGKNGVNLDGYKNIIGTFNQPEFIYWSEDFLDTLPKEEIHNGFGEILKYAIGFNKILFDVLYLDDEDYIISNKALIKRIIETCQKIKQDIVYIDEKESGPRKKLNLGHTLAHAIEKETHNRIAHGHAVGLGLHFITEYSLMNNYIDGVIYSKISEVLEKYGFKKDNELIAKSLDHIIHDKKANGDTIDLVVLKGIGECNILKTETKTLIK